MYRAGIVGLVMLLPKRHTFLSNFVFFPFPPNQITYPHSPFFFPNNSCQDLTDDLADMMEDMNEINDALGRNYGCVLEWGRRVSMRMHVGLALSVSLPPASHHSHGSHVHTPTWSSIDHYHPKPPTHTNNTSPPPHQNQTPPTTACRTRSTRRTWTRSWRPWRTTWRRWGRRTRPLPRARRGTPCRRTCSRVRGVMCFVWVWMCMCV